MRKLILICKCRCAFVRELHIFIDTLLAKPVNWHVKCHVLPDTCRHMRHDAALQVVPHVLFVRQNCSIHFGLWRNLLHDITDNAKYFQ